MQISSMRFIVILFAAAFTLGGCASYRVGSPAELPYRAIRVAPAVNRSDLPQIEALLSSAMRHEIEQSSALELSTGGRADALLEISVLEAKREMVAVSPDDVGRARKFELTLLLSVSLRDTADSSKFYFRDRTITVTQDIYTDSGQITAEYQATPELARLAATQVSELIVDLW